MFAVLLDGRTHPIEDFNVVREEFGVTKRTLRRDIQAMESVTRFRIDKSKQGSNGRTFWKSSFALIPRPDQKQKKTCAACKQPKLLEEFGADRGKHDNKSDRCKQCKHQYNKDWKASNRAHVNRYMRNYKRKQRKLG